VGEAIISVRFTANLSWQKAQLFKRWKRWYALLVFRSDFV